MRQMSFDISHIIRNMILVSKLTMTQEILNTTKYNFL